MNHSPGARDEEITLMEIAGVMLRHWRVVAGVPAVLVVLVGALTLAQDQTYVASASILPQMIDNRVGGSAAALAQQLGVSLGGERAGQSPQFYVDLLRSRSVLRQAVEADYEVTVPDGRTRRGTLVDFFETDASTGRATPVRRAMEELADNISTSVTRESGVIRLDVRADDPELAEQVASRLLEILNIVNMEVRQTRGLEEGRFVGERVADAQAELVAAEARLEEFLRQNRQFGNSPELHFEHDRLQRHVAMRQEVYTALLRSQEQARIDAVRDTPLFAVIDHPVGSAEPLSRGLAVRVVITLILGLMVSAFLAFTLEFKRRRREAGDPQFLEVQGLARQAWHELRHPGRWLKKEREPVESGDR